MLNSYDLGYSDALRNRKPTLTHGPYASGYNYGLKVQDRDRRFMMRCMCFATFAIAFMVVALV